MPPTIVLVHGAFAESDELGRRHRSASGRRACGDRRRQPAARARRATPHWSATSSVRIDGPVVLVAHSYGGAVISNVAANAGEIVGLVYINGFAPERRRELL